MRSVARLRRIAPWRLRMLRTLRGRLIAGLVALLAVACATVGIVTYFAVQNSLSRELGNQLQTATILAYNCWEHQFSHDASPSGTTGNPRGPGGPGTSPAPGSDSRTAANVHPGSVTLSACQGLADGTFTAVIANGEWHAVLIGDSSYRLSPADARILLTIPLSEAPAPQNGANTQNGQNGPDGPDGENAPTSTHYLSSANTTFELTAMRDPDGDGSVYITGMPLSGMDDQLRYVALAESVIFGCVLLLAGVLGTIWVRLSLRPLRRVAATASQVAELPLEFGDVKLPNGVPDTDPETETGQVGLAFNRMLGHVQAALHRRAASEARLRRFAADASHELRTPLAAIRGYAELALRHPGDSPEAVTHALARVLSESTRMSVLVDDLLLLARLDAGRPLGRDAVDVSRMAIEATSDSRVARPDHRWMLELPDDPVLVSGDQHRLHQVLGNLLSNAGRHTPEGTTVTVRVSAELPPGEPAAGRESVQHGTVPPGPWMVLTVTDDGPGIPADLLPDLFERFTRADTSRSHATNAASTGLGLAIVDAVVAAHGGAVLVTSRPGMTRFTIVLPRLTEPAAPERRAHPMRKALHRSLPDGQPGNCMIPRARAPSRRSRTLWGLTQTIQTSQNPWSVRYSSSAGHKNRAANRLAACGLFPWAPVSGG